MEAHKKGSSLRVSSEFKMRVRNTCDENRAVDPVNRVKPALSLKGVVCYKPRSFEVEGVFELATQEGESRT